MEYAILAAGEAASLTELRNVTCIMRETGGLFPSFPGGNILVFNRPDCNG